MVTAQQLYQSPNAIAADYARSHVSQRIFLTGHVSQAMPDCSFAAHQQAWLNAARHGEERWQEVFVQADKVREGFAGLIHSTPNCIALASSVHDLVIRFLSSLPWHKRRKVVTTEGESPSVNRQLARLEAVGIEVVRVSLTPAADVVLRVEELIDDNTAAVMVSSVFRQSGHAALELDTLLPVCEKFGAQLFVNAHHSVNVLSFSVEDYNLQNAFVVGNGMAYCQLGDGCCFMHVPPGCTMQPLITGWFGSFDPNTDNRANMPDAYGVEHTRFDGSSCDPTTYFRAAAVFDYFKTKGLNSEFLHDVNHHQLRLIAKSFKSFDFDPTLISMPTEVEFLGGFMSFLSPQANKICQKMRDFGVHTDVCGNYLRMGPAPYLTDEQITDGVLALEEAVKGISG